VASPCKTVTSTEIFWELGELGMKFDELCMFFWQGMRCFAWHSTHEIVGNFVSADDFSSFQSIGYKGDATHQVDATHDM